MSSSQTNTALGTTHSSRDLEDKLEKMETSAKSDGAVSGPESAQFELGGGLWADAVV